MEGNVTRNSSSPPFIDIPLTVNNLACGLIGLPLNAVIVAFIIFRRRLHQPRNVLWAGIALSNLFILFVHLVDLVAVYTLSSTALCHYRSSIAGLPYTSLLMNQFFSLVDRYLCINNSVWYRKSVTIRWVIGTQFFAFAILCFTMKVPYIFGLVDLNCGSSIRLYRKVSFGFIVFFFILCVIGQLIVYFKIRNYLLIDTSETSNDQPLPPETGIDMGSNPPVEQVAVNHSSNSSKYFVRIGNQNISRLELEATQNVTFGVTSLCIFATPWIVSNLFAQICNASVDLSAGTGLEQCGRYLWASAYTRGLFLIHSVCHSIFYVIRRRDFIAVLNLRSG